MSVRGLFARPHQNLAAMISCSIPPAIGKPGRKMKAICLVASLAVLCEMAGAIEVDDDVPQEAVVDRLMELAAARLGRREPTLSFPRSHNFAWLGEDAEPFDRVFLHGIGGDVSISFLFKNIGACQTEQEVADEAAVEAALAPITLQ